MSTMTNRPARPCGNAAASAAAQDLPPADGSSAFARDMVWVMSPSDGMTWIGGKTETGRAFLAGDDT
jgi:hypothetical protein